MPAFKNNATLTFNGRSVLSNTVTGEISEVISGSKTAPVDVYRTGDRITYTFEIANSGLSPVEATDEVTLTDVFDPVLTSPTVSYNGTTLSACTDYTYTDGTLTVLPGAITLPAATASQSETGEWVVEPGTGTLTVTGTI